MQQATGYWKKAAETAREALEWEPQKIANLRALSVSSGGALRDWRLDNHHELIEYYLEYIEKNPNYEPGYQELLDNLLSD